MNSWLRWRKFSNWKTWEKCLNFLECRFVKSTLKKFNMEDGKPMTTSMYHKEKLIKDDSSDKVDEASYRSMVGCLVYLTAMRPDIQKEVSVLSIILNCSSEMHMKATKRIIRHVKGIWTTVLDSRKVKSSSCKGVLIVIGLGQMTTWKSTSSYCLSFSSGCFSWCSKSKVSWHSQLSKLNLQLLLQLLIMLFG